MPVPELILKKRRAIQRDARSAAERATAREERAKFVREHAIKSAQKYAKEYHEAELAEKRAREQALAAGRIHVPEEARIYLVIRIRGIVGVAPKPRTILALFRLRQINNAVFIRCNTATLGALRLIDPYVTYGEPSLETVRALVYKRGFASVGGMRVPIVDNELIDEHLGEHGLLCAEDVVHELYTCGPHFGEASRFLWPFKLSPPKLRSKANAFTEGGDFGYRGSYINSFVADMI
ncbi:Ribosomal protein L7 [Giardia muris]|uniref:Ribosomal protein L7 n=1 Tax=Giardia muris TaxID=5742 RepID=A0A4Z1T0L1_GIAMU|nr:Ribosomal protein L7 [Giardia muris]|eukprot:TNJ27443.1 Ribosomal protein L7 [Giardia muris]